MSDKLFGHVQRALEALAVEHSPQVAPIAEWIEDTTRFVERIAALDPEDVPTEQRQLIQQLMQSAAQLIIVAQQDVLKQVVATAMALEQQQKQQRRLVKAHSLPGRPAQLVRP